MRFYLVYWPKEMAVSVVGESDVLSASVQMPSVGSECVIKVQGKKFTGVIAAIGKLL